MRSNQKKLNPKYTFETFIVGATNEMAFDAALHVAEHPAEKYNPLYITGGFGLGKTHLLHAIGNHIVQNNPSSNVLYISSAEFVDQWILNMQKGRILKFRDKFMRLDVFLFDDVQLIAGKCQTSMIISHIIDALTLARKQIVITGTNPPQKIKDLENRIQNQLAKGFTVNIDPP